MMFNISDIDQHLRAWEDYSEYVNNTAAIYTKTEDEKRYENGWAKYTIFDDSRDFLPIYCEDTVVGHLCYDEYRHREYLTARGDDPEILNILQVWYNGRKRMQEKELENERRKFRLETEKKMKKEVTEARKALGLD